MSSLADKPSLALLGLAQLQQRKSFVTVVVACLGTMLLVLLGLGLFSLNRSAKGMNTFLILPLTQLPILVLLVPRLKALKAELEARKVRTQAQRGIAAALPQTSSLI